MYLCLQLKFAAICCDQGSQEWRMYAVDVENTSVLNGTLNFTFASSRLVQPSEEVIKFCGQVWMEGPQSMEGSELQCKISPDDKRYEYMYNCSSNSGMVCRRNDNTSCIVPIEGGSKVLVFVFTHNWFVLSSKKHCANHAHCKKQPVCGQSSTLGTLLCIPYLSSRVCWIMFEVLAITRNCLSYLYLHLSECAANCWKQKSVVLAFTPQQSTTFIVYLYRAMLECIWMH